MAQSSTIVTLTQLCDAALNTHEVGIVNFTLLRTLLHVLIKQVKLDETKVEYRGVDSERIQSFLSNIQPGTQLLTEYAITGSKEIPEQKEGQIVVVTSTAVEHPEFTVTMTTDHLDQMEKSIKKLQAKVTELEELPGNLKLQEALKAEGSSPVLDMFQILNLQKRMDAVDISIEKLASMLETAAKESGMKIATGNEDDVGMLSLIDKRVTVLESQIEKRGSKGSRVSRVSGIRKPAKESSKDLVKASSKDMVVDDGDVMQAITKLEKDVQDLKDVVFNTGGGGGGGGPEEASQAPIRISGQLAPLRLSIGTENQPVEIRVKGVENKLSEFMEQLNSLDSGFSRLLNVMQGRIEELEKEIGEVLERVHLIPSSGETGETTNKIETVQKQLNLLEGDFENILENLKKLTDERAAKEHAVDVLIEQIELLKTVKADREDLEDALADKADACQINRKVSYEQFDQAYGDMNKSLEEALAKITQQESLWTQTLMNMQGEVGSKMDKNELAPLREFINNKLKSLQEKFKTLSAMKKDQEAAGTKTRFLRNVNCISCDKDVVMRRDVDPSMYPKPYALPPAKSMGPYLAYELDQLRKQQKCVPSNKNMNVFENALLTSRSGKSPDHVCNRYCGGSHTVTTPQQRVTRLGHFMEQWGPEIAPVVDAHVRGTDGKMYKSRDDEQLKKLAAEKPPSAHADSTAPALFVSGDPSYTTKTSLQNQHESLPPDSNRAPSQPSMKEESKIKVVSNTRVSNMPPSESKVKVASNTTASGMPSAPIKEEHEEAEDTTAKETQSKQQTA